MDRGTGHEIHVERDQDEKCDSREINRPYTLQYEERDETFANRQRLGTEESKQG